MGRRTREYDTLTSDFEPRVQRQTGPKHCNRLCERGGLASPRLHGRPLLIGVSLLRRGYVRTKVRCTSSAGARTRSGNQLPTPFETISLLAPLL